MESGRQTTTFDLSPLDAVQAPETFKDGNLIGALYKPKTLEKPTCPTEVVAGLERLTNDKIIRYFLDLLQNETRVITINGTCDSSLYCDYCPCTSISREYYYCYDCNKDMCCACFSEVSEEIALKNGAKNWHKRKDALALCRGTHRLHQRDFIIPCCDKCDLGINMFVPYFSNGAGDDVCASCQTPSLVEENNLRETTIPANVIENNDHFGNMLDWVPLYQDMQEAEEAFILQCSNKENQFYRHLALACCDDHGRFGYYTCSASTTLESLLAEFSGVKEKTDARLKRYEEKKRVRDGGGLSDDSDDSARSGWWRFYNSPLRQMMTKRNMKIHFG